MNELQYPIGLFDFDGHVSAEIVEQWIREIEALPAALREAVNGLNDQQMNTPYRPGGWTAAQVVHHIADSHMNSLIRFKLAMTEDCPAIKPYDEAAWAETADYSEVALDRTLLFIELLHERLAVVLRSLTEEDWGKSFNHPDMGAVKLGWNIGNYAWHGNHHVAQISALRERNQWRKNF